jgi:hypothetical protein
MKFGTGLWIIGRLVGRESLYVKEVVACPDNSDAVDHIEIVM